MGGTVFFRLLEAEDKEAALERVLLDVVAGEFGQEELPVVTNGDCARPGACACWSPRCGEPPGVRDAPAHRWNHSFGIPSAARIRSGVRSPITSWTAGKNVV